ncbi:Myb-like DNA-binding domain-containing protein [Spironucleus salmonicida]|uniref:Myb-like DNA-binding domain-containing protein n=1 Tax=Spironucleus salmonicida TaxID=348837 RepID=V6LQX7_9EUKA|nr:Myb-like DNA-binding domain-containing protein [Spironucleus salmonicida]|eukprot:EST46995.1 Myb-like DNA-binding domain-containing protein [Spironucleus salmonicida]
MLDDLQQYLNYSYSNSLYFCYSNLDKFPDSPEIYAETIQFILNSPSLQINSTDARQSSLSKDSKDANQVTDSPELQSYLKQISTIINQQPLQVKQSYQQYVNRKSDTHQDRALPQYWTQEMSDKLTYLKQKKQYLSFVQIADLLNQQCETNLKPNQVQQRWQRVQSPDIVKGRWTKEESDLLSYLHKKHNGKLSTIQQQLQYRTILQIRNRLKQLNLIE